MVEQVPFALVLYDAVVSGPSHYGVEDDALELERPIRRVADGVAEVMAVSCRV